MKHKIFYPTCIHLDIYKRDVKGNFYCHNRRCYVVPHISVKASDGKYCPRFCAPDCYGRRGKTSIEEGGAW